MKSLFFMMMFTLIIMFTYHDVNVPRKNDEDDDNTGGNGIDPNDPKLPLNPFIDRTIKTQEELDLVTRSILV